MFHELIDSTNKCLQFVIFRLAVLKYNYHFAKKSPKVQQSTAQILCQVGTYYNDKCR